METIRKLCGCHTDLIHKYDTSVSHMWNGLFTFQLFEANRDGCHMWDRKCSLFRELKVLHRNILETGVLTRVVHNSSPTRLVFSHEWFIIHLQRDEVELEMNSEPRV